MQPELARTRPHFDDLTPLYPDQRLRLEDGNPSDTARLIVSPPKAGKTMVLQAILSQVQRSVPRPAASAA
jgi:transcription termination factor Rho